MPDITINRPLAGGAKNLLDDLTELNRKVTSEMERGVREGYLEQDKLDGLAEKLGVAKPRIKAQRWVYFETRQIHSYAVMAYDDDDAIRVAREQIDTQLRNGETPYGARRSYWNGDARRRNIIVSELTATRPRRDHGLRFFTGDQEPEAIGTAVHEVVEQVGRRMQEGVAERVQLLAQAAREANRQPGIRISDDVF